MLGVVHGSGVVLARAWFDRRKPVLDTRRSISAELDLDQPMQDVRHEAVLNIVHTAGFLSQAGGGLFRAYGLTEAQFNVLFALHYATHPLTQTELGRRLVVTRASITSLIDKLEEKGLVERRAVEGNRRIYHLIRTDEGKELFAQVEPVYRDRIHAAMNELSAEEQRTLIGMLERVRAGVEKVEAAAASSGQKKRPKENALS